MATQETFLNHNNINRATSVTEIMKNDVDIKNDDEIFLFSVMEMVGPKGQVWGGILHGNGFTLGIIIIAILAFLLPQWMPLQLAITIPAVVFLIYIW